MSEYRRPVNPTEAHAFYAAERADLPAPLQGAERQAVLNRLRSMLEAHDWKYAKSMPSTPHWYSIIEKNWQGEEEEFYSCVLGVRLYGDLVTWRGWPYIELTLGGFVYWTMGYPIRGTTLINRKPLP